MGYQGRAPVHEKTGSFAIAPEQPALPPPPEPSAISQLSLFDLEKIKADNYINLYNEKELHIQVVHYIRRFHPEAVMMAGQGELQQTPSQRIEGKMKGYQKGCCDLMNLKQSHGLQRHVHRAQEPSGNGDRRR